MHITSLRIENFRNLQQVEVTPHRDFNYFFGPNGAGKTSILEALVVLSRGRSFRTAQAEELIGERARSFSVFLELSGDDGGAHRLGLERSGRYWKARKDGQDQPVLSVLTRHVPLVLMEPNSHLLISGTADGRRRFLDWGVFHVEPTFLDTWRRFGRVLKQRNAALRNRDERVLDSLDELAARLGDAVHAFRNGYFARLRDRFEPLGGQDQAVAGVTMEYLPGWKEGSLHDALQRSHKRDLELGTTSFGPHRGDILFNAGQKSARAMLSRGEQKALVASLLLTQARLLAEHGEKPLILLDDLASELDNEHLAAVMDATTDCAGQVWVTGVLEPVLDRENKRFHVEQGTVREV